jgi:hypothetical protein
MRGIEGVISSVLGVVHMHAIWEPCEVLQKKKRCISQIL